ncbi:MAG: metallophosphoesterase [Kiritimatiellae bacterium]|nr:metallophosphoesterase [Kiritimatiellia bacterium]
MKLNINWREFGIQILKAIWPVIAGALTGATVVTAPGCTSRAIKQVVAAQPQNRLVRHCFTCKERPEMLRYPQLHHMQEALMTRRDFITNTTAGLAAAALGGCVQTLANSRRFDDTLSVLISDTHVHADSYQRERLTRVVDEILRLDPLPRRVFCFGDIAFLRGPLEDYQAGRPVFQRLRDAGIELIFGMGNHDRREAFGEVWGDCQPKSLVPGHWVSETNLGPCDLVMLDTLHEPDTPEAHTRGWITDGQLKGVQREWLDAELKRRTRPFFLCAHHPLDEITDGDWKAIKDGLMASACIGWIHGHDHAWKHRLIAPTKRRWGDNNFKRSLCLPSTGHWGDIGYVTFRVSAHEARASYCAMDHYFPTPDKRTPMDADLLEEKRNAFMTFRF